MGFLSFLFESSDTRDSAPMPRFFNTLTKEKQDFTLSPGSKYVRMYNCGPTVYGRQHIGNLSMFVFTDILRRTLEYSGLTVKQTINITDFGHLTSDADEGEDKMLKGLKREKLRPTMANMKVLAEKYTNIFLEDIRALNIEVNSVTFPRASEYIEAQVAMIRTLEEKGYAYKSEDGVYYDTSRFPAYGALGNINLEGQQEGARVTAKSHKRNPADFILWKFSPAGARGGSKMGWESPWGRGFPGWHIECSAMARATLGEQIDIHTGGIEHVAIHHNNEIAQSEAATGKKPFSRFWMHRNHIQIDGGKIAKSVEGSVVYLSDIVERGYHPLSLRYLFMGAHYRTPMNFTWEALTAAQTAYGKLLALTEKLKEGGAGSVDKSWKAKFTERIDDDLDTPGAIALMWEMTRDKNLSPSDLLATILNFDRVLALRLNEPDEAAKNLVLSHSEVSMSLADLPQDVRQLIHDREEARANKDWEKSDFLRQQIENAGFKIKDTADGSQVFKQ
jgi:cysteinyl-tRNA synthetase